MPVLLAENDMNLWWDGMQLDENSAFLNDATLTLSLGREDITGEITDATNASPIVVTSAAHGLTNGKTVVITQVKGNRAANGTWVVASATADTFTLTGSTGDGVYTQGGAWYLGPTGATSLPMTYVTGSNGRYFAVLPRSAEVIRGRQYRAIMFCEEYGCEIERIYDAVIRG